MDKLKLTIFPKLNHITFLLDAILILFNISNTYTIIPFYFLSYKLSYNAIIIFIINIIYLIVRFRGKIRFPKLNDYLFYLFVLINIINFTFSALTNSLILGYVTLFSVNTSFYLIMFNLIINYRSKYSFNDSIYLLERGYIWLCMYAIVLVLFFLILIELFNFDPRFNPISYENFDFLKDNITRLKAQYFSPFNLTFFYSSPYERLPFFHKYGIITGIFHEPHTMTFVVYPSLFLILYFIRKFWIKILLIISFIFYSLVAASAMNILALLACIAVLLGIKYRKALLIVMIVLVLGGIYLYTSNNPISELIRTRFSSGSLKYSLYTLEYSFTPITLIGSNFLDGSHVKNYVPIDSNNNIGIIIFALNVLFLIILIYKIFKLLTYKSQRTKLIGLFGLYFLVHSSKLTMSNYSLSLLIFVIFIINVFYNEIINSSNLNNLEFTG